MFLNSLDKLGWYSGYRHEINDFGIEAILTTGYDYPLGPSARVTYDINDNTRIFANPGFEGERTGLVVGIEILTK